MMGKCDHAESSVRNSRVISGNRYRRRECIDCGHRWSTVEFEVELKSGIHPGKNGHLEALREKVGLSRRLQEAIGELIDAALEQAEE